MGLWGRGGGVGTGWLCESPPVCLIRRTVAAQYMLPRTETPRRTGGEAPDGSRLASPFPAPVPCPLFPRQQKAP